MLPSSREAVQDHVKNQWLAEQVPGLFARAVDLFLDKAESVEGGDGDGDEDGDEKETEPGASSSSSSSEDVVSIARAHILSLMFAYIPVQEEVRGFLKSVAPRIAELLQRKSCVPVSQHVGATTGTSGACDLTYVTPTEAVLLPALLHESTEKVTDSGDKGGTGARVANPDASADTKATSEIAMVTKSIEILGEMHLHPVDENVVISAPVAAALGIRSVDGNLSLQIQTLRQCTLGWKSAEAAVGDAPWIAWLLA